MNLWSHDRMQIITFFAFSVPEVLSRYFMAVLKFPSWVFHAPRVDNFQINTDLPAIFVLAF